MLLELARGRLVKVQVAAPVRGLRLLAEDLPVFVPQRQDLFDERPQPRPGCNCASVCARAWG